MLHIGHTHEMLDVAKSEFDAIFSVNKVAIHKIGKTLEHPAAVNLGTIQLLRKNLARLKPESFDYVVIDEFHHTRLNRIAKF